jgi:hypothetical protein
MKREIVYKDTEFESKIFNYKCIDAYKEVEKPKEWEKCKECGLIPLVWEFDNGRSTACGCGKDMYSHFSVGAKSIMSVIKESYNGKSAEKYDGDELRKNWNAYNNKQQSILLEENLYNLGE